MYYTKIIISLLIIVSITIAEATTLEDSVIIRSDQPLIEKGTEKDPTMTRLAASSGVSFGIARPEKDRKFVVEAIFDIYIFGGDLKSFPNNFYGGIYGSLGSFNGHDVRGEVGAQVGFMMFSVGGGYSQVRTNHGIEHGYSVHSKFPVYAVSPYLRYSHYDSYDYFETGLSFKLPMPVGVGRNFWMALDRKFNRRR